MEFTGQLTPYSIDRPLSSSEREHQLMQSQRLDVDIYHELSVIEINSNWLEVVDKFFFNKGAVTLVSIFVIVFQFWVMSTFILLSLTELLRGDFSGLIIWGLFIIVIPACVFFWGKMKSEINYTHYPIRFNRKTRMVHVFRQDGTVLSVKWEKVFFTQVRVTNGMWDTVGHVLDEDGITVRETFGLPASGVGVKGRESAKGYWEFIRRFMEEGPASVSGVISGCLPIKDKKETFRFSFERIAASLGSYINPLILVYYAFYPGRMIAMHFSKIPQWPAEIEAQCQRLDGHDPFFRDASMNT